MSPAQPEEKPPYLSMVAKAFACPPDVAAQVLSRGRLRQFADRAIILRQGDWLTLAYLLVRGRAQALLYGSEGQLILLHELWPGDLFGAVCDTEPVRQDADVVAHDEVETFVLEATQLARLAAQHGAIGLALSRMLMARLRQMTGRMYERAALSAVGRVYAELLREAQRSPGLRLSPPPVISELALRVSTTRETASRAVNALERRGIIRRDAASLTVVAPHRLESLII
jgi:CRP/FNR family transcriptional regulator, cyclic AMP receptor protein